MAKTYLINIDLSRMVANRREAEQEPQWDEAQAMDYLRESGMRLTPAGWVTETLPSQKLRPDEYALVDRYA